MILEFFREETGTTRSFVGREVEGGILLWLMVLIIVKIVYCKIWM